MAQGASPGYYRDITVQGFQLREYVAPATDNALGIVDEAVIVVRNLQEMNRALERLKVILILVSLGRDRRGSRRRAPSSRARHSLRCAG